MEFRREHPESFRPYSVQERNGYLSCLVQSLLPQALA
jgi:hypothetical protein